MAYLDHLGLKEGVLDVPSRRQESEAPNEHLVPPRQLKALGTVPLVINEQNNPITTWWRAYRIAKIWYSITSSIKYSGRARNDQGTSCGSGNLKECRV